MGRRPILLVFVAAAAILTLAADAQGQGRAGGASSFGSLGGGSSLGQSSFGQSSFGGSSMGQSGFGQSGFGQSSFGQSSFGRSGAGQSSGGLSASPFGAAGGFGAQTAGVQSQGFVGRSGADMQNFFGGASQQQFRNAMQRSQRAGRDAGGGGAEGDTERRPAVRVRLTLSDRLSQTVARSAPSVRAAESNVADLFRRKGYGQVSVSAAEGVLTLRGAVASESERMVAEKLAEMEPGVERVENELVVAAEPPELLPAPR
ncbi:BON domain-containing protein [Botrimarina sp.]|uniref:BON domain-containing protein n=1 Tax=Botrimarina sp. TaxID=2795802 RepID=UPI0032EFB621